MTKVQTFNYNGNNITFVTGQGIKVNATEMAKPFGKRPVDWLRFQQSQEFITALSNVGNHTFADLVQVKQGSALNGGGTWMHEDVALEFARWLSPAFAIWCNRRIKELLTAPQQPAGEKLLPPPSNQHCISDLTEVVDNKCVTTSRKLAAVLGRTHDSVCDTIRENLDKRAFKYGNFIRRKYNTGSSHGSEFLITKTGLQALAAIMRNGAKEKIAEAYQGKWGNAARLTPALLPLAHGDEPAALATETQEDPDNTHELAEWIDDLRRDLRKARNTQQLYSEMYEAEKHKRMAAMDTAGYWQGLYDDLLWRLLDDTGSPADEKIKQHAAFRDKMKSARHSVK